MRNKERNQKCLCGTGKKTKKCFPFHTEEQTKMYNKNLTNNLKRSPNTPTKGMFFYKAEQDDGITCQMMFDDETWERYNELVDMTILDIQNSNDVDEKWYLNQLKEMIPHYWYHMSDGRTSIQPSKGKSIMSEWGLPKKEGYLEEGVTTGMLICGNIGALVELGVIKQDNFNGHMFMTDHDFGRMVSV